MLTRIETKTTTILTTKIETLNTFSFKLTGMLKKSKMNYSLKKQSTNYR